MISWLSLRCIQRHRQSPLARNVIYLLSARTKVSEREVDREDEERSNTGECAGDGGNIAGSKANVETFAVV